jgi:hypothetical protein
MATATPKPGSGPLAVIDMRYTTAVTAILLSCCSVLADSRDRGRFEKWSKIELLFTGPDSQGRGKPNPFGVRLDVAFTSPSGKEYHVPGFYDGDGKGSLDGSVWKVRFSADELGQWRFNTSSDHKRLDGKTDWFTVARTRENAPGFWRWGRLESTGTAENQIRYLKFRDGPYWPKAGCDDPENFLGNYRNYSTFAKRKAAIDFLAGRGVNSFCIMTHNVGGDDKSSVAPGTCCCTTSPTNTTFGLMRSRPRTEMALRHRSVCCPTGQSKLTTLNYPLLV